MQQVKFDQVQLPALGMGTWHMGDQVAKRDAEIKALRYGLDHGLRVIDTAEMYGSGRSESLVGAAIQPYSRQDLFIISKFYPQNATKQRMQQSLTASLQRLGTDYLDLYLLHWRGRVPLAETVAGLEDLKRAGKIRYWGVSNFDQADLLELQQINAGQNLAANEDLYNLGARGVEFDVLPWQQQRQIPFIAYSPVAQGDKRFNNNAVVQAVAAAHNLSVPQVLLAWTLRQPNLLAIPQTSNWQHMQANIAAADIILTTAELTALDREFPAPTRKQPLEII
ncbi:aldo/keto reductase [Loigolactobacillus coryniformis]|uniref:aldo/keto reductase n=1 Tax=Loigolactobacillus coryniformis TaxID=1610 RepID=UPI00201A6C1C|nr:aldo/keto reductase [Loigolactobacillus coryniformis]MCL5457639.1 aldo/keto reductase [Loigolactobacillus coryniformis]